jgi:hypothetical protein
VVDALVWCAGFDDRFRTGFRLRLGAGFWLRLGASLGQRAPRAADLARSAANIARSTPGERAPGSARRCACSAASPAIAPSSPVCAGSTRSATNIARSSPVCSCSSPVRIVARIRFRSDYVNPKVRRSVKSRTSSARRAVHACIATHEAQRLSSSERVPSATDNERNNS